MTYKENPLHQVMNEEGSYTVICNVTGAKEPVTKTIIVKPLFDLTVEGATEIYVGETLELTAKNGSTVIDGNDVLWEVNKQS